ncbi:putative DNA modification/repair radical SAM protein [Haloimpatiens lingqiaonensis]|uniref:putative DNA modification/repair radical SAM protein n=1 Tax=Haloimpatiens lingqiaonensis TaxID=1380675 RepID=UPI0010FDA6D0|nr:putative DNA modification/repair radical SAM protein [Haloimpatiens lingqiaonensis]
MDVFEKLSILSAAAKYDVSCSSSGSNRRNKKGGIGNASYSGICHSFTPDGRCISLLKILLTNYCSYDCAYCINRASNDVPRAAFTPEEVVDLTINFYKRNYIEGLFLSSAVYKNANYTMELLIKVVESLRNVHNFNGYIHLKAIPGADEALIKRAGTFADRMSVNIELPSSESLKLLAPQKNKEKILKPMSLIKSNIAIIKHEKKIYKRTPNFVPAGQSSQLIIGATPESDFQIMKLSEGLYKNFDLKRVYYSAYIPVGNGKKITKVDTPPTLREHRLYQADWLLRFYGFSAKELLDDKKPNFDLQLDPKTDWALRHLELFPIEINKAPREMLLRIPGIGVRSVNRILSIRRVHSIKVEDLKKIGVVLKRAKYFITCEGKYCGSCSFKEESIRQNIIIPKKNVNDGNYYQLSFFDRLLQDNSVINDYSKITGQL